MMNIWKARYPRRYALIGCISVAVFILVIFSEVLNPWSVPDDDHSNEPKTCDQITLTKHYMRNLRYEKQKRNGSVDFFDMGFSIVFPVNGQRRKWNTPSAEIKQIF